jgi:hypothetical protein
MAWAQFERLHACPWKNNAHIHERLIAHAKANLRSIGLVATKGKK